MAGSPKVESQAIDPPSDRAPKEWRSIAEDRVAGRLAVSPRPLGPVRHSFIRQTMHISPALADQYAGALRHPFDRENAVVCYEQEQASGILVITSAPQAG